MNCATHSAKDALSANVSSKHMIPFKISIQDFSGVYNEQPFMKELKDVLHASWFDCSQLNSTDCYCDNEAQEALSQMIATHPVQGLHFMDNGNYHYMTKLWVEKIHEPFSLAIFDHHPDMQPPRFEGILSCGGWVKALLETSSFIQNVYIIGVADKLIKELKEDESCEFHKYKTKVKFVPETKLQEISIIELLNQEKNPLYVSLDKDVLCREEAVTNWDQGSLKFQTLKNTLEFLLTEKDVIGMDVCGERAKDMDFLEAQIADKINNQMNMDIVQLFSNSKNHEF